MNKHLTLKSALRIIAATTREIVSFRSFDGDEEQN